LCPLTGLGPDIASQRGMRANKILCAVDFSDCSKTALQVAADLAKQHEGSLMLVHVHVPPGYEYSGGVFNMADAAADLGAAARQALVPWVKDAEARSASKVEVVTLMGTPWDEIVRLARTSAADVIVVGTHGRSGLNRALIGSVAERVVRHAPCNVLVVRSQL
jgi:nucleotide-binding universal stress UspA family protein